MQRLAGEIYILGDVSDAEFAVYLMMTMITYVEVLEAFHILRFLFGIAFH